MSDAQTRGTASQAKPDGESTDVLSPGLLERRRITTLGVLGVCAGVATLAVSEFLPTVNLLSYVSLVVFCAITVLLWVFVREYETDAVEQAATGDVEYRLDVSVPGGEFDAALETAVRPSNWGRVQAKRTVVTQLREVAATVVSHHERTSLEDGREAVESGSWTDDETASILLAIGTQSFSAWPTLPFDRRQGFDYNVEQVVTALEALTPGYESEGTQTGVESSRPDVVATTALEGGPTDRRTGRWYGLHAVALAMLGLGILTTSPALVVGTALLAGVAGYGQFAATPDVELCVQRDVSETDPDPGEEVRVRVTVRNDGGQFLPDLRLVDAVPPALRVTDGSPRYATALRPEKSATFSYTVRAARGTHEFDALQVIARNGAGTIERERYVESGDATTVDCGLELRGRSEVPVHPKTARRVGRVTTDTGGAGGEFHSVREYRRGDPLSRVDWNRLARSGDLATQEFREEQAATVVLVVDARASAFAAPRADGKAAIDREREAADVILSALISSGDSVGLAAISPDHCWLEPRGGRSQQARARSLIESHQVFTGTAPEDGTGRERTVRRLRREFPGSAQLVFLSPLLDEDSVEIARDFHASGYPVTVVSPNVTGSDSTGKQLARIDRAIKVSSVRRSGMRVIDWHPETPLGAALEMAQRRWKQ
jgi:uncharacterized protein (DUF58 family)